MVLFYTDLLAKLWALDFASSAPDARIPEFRSMSHEVLSPIDEREAEVLPSTRLWFGVQPQGFSLQDDGAPSLLLAPVATRLFAASSDSLTPGEEVAPVPPVPRSWDGGTTTMPKSRGSSRSTSG